jgi:NAD-dependent deacetylase
MTALPRARDFDRVVFFTGAGMSAESGVPTFRGRGGIWSSYHPEQIASQEAFDRDPERVWEFHNWRRGLVAACQPNDGHHLVAAAQRALPHVTVVTQNIDGLHQVAGATGVLELHGSLWRLRDQATGQLVDNRDVPLTDLKTPSGGYWRPDIVWFGDNLREDVIDAAMQAITSCQLLISIGTSAVVYPAAQMPLYAREAGATLVEINPEPTPISSIYHHCLREPATTALARLCHGIPR